MPKEIIRDRFYRADPSGDGHDSYVRVGWSKGEGDHVQIATALPAEAKKVKMAFWDEPTKAWIDFDPIEDAGLFVQLDRFGINRLIRTLRKARDDAFGADA